MSIAFPDLPSDKAPRACGVEIEFGGLNEDRVAEIVRTRLGGTVVRTAPHAARVSDTVVGDVKIELDTALRKLDGVPFLEEGLDVLRAVIPVEVVTQPLTADLMPRLDALVADLRDAGAQGSRSGVLLGFGVHLNPARPDDAPDHPCRIAAAYGLLEDRLRDAGAIDRTRRLLPFVDPWPAALVDALAMNRPKDVGALSRLYARHTRSRNHGLDLLPLLKDADPDGFAALFPDGDDIAPRPAYHFRLPDCRIDEPGWSLADAWADWMRVEHLAADPDRLDALCAERGNPSPVAEGAP